MEPSTDDVLKIWLSPRSGGAKIQTLSTSNLVFGYVVATIQKVWKMQKNQNLNSGKKFYGKKRFEFFEFWICHNLPTVWNFLAPHASNWPSVKSRIVVRRKIKSDKFYCHFLKIFKNFPEISRNFDVLRFLASRPNQGVFQRTDCTSGVLKLFLKGLLGQKFFS